MILSDHMHQTAKISVLQNATLIKQYQILEFTDEAIDLVGLPIWFEKNKKIQIAFHSVFWVRRSSSLLLELLSSAALRCTRLSLPLFLLRPYCLVVLWVCFAWVLSHTTAWLRESAVEVAVELMWVVKQWKCGCSKKELRTASKQLFGSVVNFWSFGANPAMTD